MNKRGQIFMGIILAVFIFIMGVPFIALSHDSIDSVRTGLQCSNPTNITGGNMLTCLITDASAPYMIWLLISVALSFIIGRLR
jgi:hypothetical protein